MIPANQLYLASASPRRKTLLEQIGIRFQILSVDVSENLIPGELPRQYADRLALAKAQAGWLSPDRQENIPVLGADSIVVINETILEKPKDKEDGVRMLRLLSGKYHEVITSIALVQDKHIASTSSISRVKFREISLQEAQAYWHSGEPADKAGAYGIQGKAAVFVEHIEGSYSGIMGLPLYETAALLQEFGT